MVFLSTELINCVSLNKGDLPQRRKQNVYRHAMDVQPLLQPFEYNTATFKLSTLYYSTTANLIDTVIFQPHQII